MKHEDIIEAVANWFKADRDVTLIAKGYGKGFPNPDIRAEYRNGEIAFVECKPSDAGGREYVTGLGQCIAYLTFAEFAYLALPEKELQQYQRYLWIEDVGLLSVKEDFNVLVARPAQKSKVLTTKEEPRMRGYGYYRDLKPFEIYKILRAVQSERLRQKEVDIKQIEEAMWEEVQKMRAIKSQKQRSAWILNIKLLLRDLQLINLNDYSLTEDGFRLLQLGDLPNKEPYLKELARCFLINANYLDIITIIQSLNDEYNGFSSSSQFRDYLVKKMVKEKLATDKTNVLRDLQDIPRILRDLKIMSDWKKQGLTYRYNINWKYVLSLIK
jgi:hypothetical protein